MCDGDTDWANLNDWADFLRLGLQWRCIGQLINIKQPQKLNQMINENYLHSALTSDILKAYYKVYNTFGYGFLEKVYENAMMIQLDNMCIYAVQQKAIEVFYEGQRVGKYYADLLVENKVIIELKACRTLAPEHEAQLYNYLRATEVEVGMLLNFGERPEHKRRILTNDNKPFQNL